MAPTSAYSFAISLPLYFSRIGRTSGASNIAIAIKIIKDVLNTMEKQKLTFQEGNQPDQSQIAFAFLSSSFLARFPFWYDNDIVRV